MKEYRPIQRAKKLHLVKFKVIYFLSYYYYEIFY